MTFEQELNKNYEIELKKIENEVKTDIKHFFETVMHHQPARDKKEFKESDDILTDYATSKLVLKLRELLLFSIDYTSENSDAWTTVNGRILKAGAKKMVINVQDYHNDFLRAHREKRDSNDKN